MVCRSQRKEVGVGAAVVDDPDVLLVDPELRCRAWLFGVEDADGAGLAD
jgi:hypothetical protein